MKKLQLMILCLILFTIVSQTYSQNMKGNSRHRTWVQLSFLLNEFDSAEKIVDKNNPARSQFEKIKQELKALVTSENKSFSSITLWFLQMDTAFLSTYRSEGDSRYLTAALKDIKAILEANRNPDVYEDKVTIIVETVAAGDKICKGFFIKWTSDEWKDLPNRPEAFFDSTSTASEDFPINRNIVFWSVDAENPSNKGTEKSSITDKTKTIQIGKPGASGCSK